MAAALLQYQACLGIMVRLQVEDLSLLKQDFDRAGRGLSLREFVSVMLDRVSWEPESVVGFIEDLVELFAQVDVNGDGSMEWEEFTSAIIEGGMGSSTSGGEEATGSATELRDLQYEEHPRFTDTAVNRPPKRLEYLPEFRRLLLLESSRPVVELLDPAGLFPPETDEDGKEGGAGSDNGKGVTPELSSGGDDGASSASSFSFTPTLPVLNKFHPLCYISGYRRDQDDVRSERSPVQALKYLAGADLLAVSAGDLKLTFWSTSLLTACSSSALETPRPLAVVHTPRPQRVLEWSAATRQLFSISADLLISVWLVTRDRSSSTGGGASARGAGSKALKSDGTCEVRLVATLKKHTDLLQDLLILNSDTLLSCGMDGLIYFWDTHLLLPRASRQGHRRGVRLLEKLSAQVFLSAGFECEVFGWEISALATSPVFRLSGHSSPVCCIQLVPSAAFASAAQSKSSSTSGASSVDSTRLLADQVITVDDDGWFRWWSLANVLSMESTDAELSSSRRCLQAFRLGSDASRYPWRAHSLAVLNHGQSLLVAGVHKLKLLRRVRVKPRVLAASAVLYNEASLTLATATDREVRVWDAASGALLRSYRELVGADITCVDLDARQRKIVVGAQNGELAVVNYLNGAVLSRWTPHAQQVSALLYCKEDRCVLTASWDRSLRLYDDDAPRTGGGGARSALLRCITDAHESDIKCLAYCHALSLVASGGTDGVIKIWDYIYFLLEDTCVAPTTEAASSSGAFLPSPAAHSQAQSDVNVLEFVEPYPLLLSGHESGQVCVWSLTPSKPTSLLLCFYPFRMAPPPVMPRLSLAAVTLEEKAAGVEGEKTTEDTTEMTATDAEFAGTITTEAIVTERSAQESGVASLDDSEMTPAPEDASMETDLHVADTLEASSTPVTLPPPPPSSPMTPAKLNSAVTCCRAFYDETGGEQLAAGIDRGRFLLFAASFYGELSVCDVSQVITSAHVRAFREENMPSRQDRAYNPRRRFLRQGKNAKRLRSKHVYHSPGNGGVPLQVKETDVVCVNRWTAHRGNVRCLQVVDDPRGVLTCGSDKGVKVWDFEGRCLGSLATGSASTVPQPPPAPGKGAIDAIAVGSDTIDSDGDTWRWEVDVAQASVAKRAQAQSLWDEFKITKTKTVSARQPTSLPTTRAQQSDHTLSTSESAPVLRRASRGSLRCLLEDTMVSSSSTGALEPSEPGVHTPAGSRRERISTASSSCSNHAQRLFQQLQGKTTWKQSDLQLARQAAWEKERVKFQQRMKKIMKRKSKKQLQEQQGRATSGANGGNQHDGDSGEVHSGAPDGGVSDSLGSLSAGGSVGDAIGSSLQLPTLQHPVAELPFADKDNWEVGSLNRERQMYAHFHRENVRRSNKQIAGSSGLLRQRRLESSLASMDLTPSPFLLEKLGVSCIIRENQEDENPPPRRRVGKKPRPKRVSALQRTASTPTLPPRHETKQQDDSQPEATLATSASTGALPKRTLIEALCQQYDELLGVDDDEPGSTQNHADHTARLLNRAASFAPRSRAALDPVDTSGDDKYQGSSTTEADKPAASQTDSYKVRRRGLRASRLATSNAKTRKETVADGSHAEKESPSTKKVRIRSDAALMRQERFGPYAREDVLNVYRTFRKLDQDQSGSITLRELFGGAGLFSGTHLQDNIGSIFSSIDQDQSGQIDLAELCSVVFGDAPATVLGEILRLCRLLETVEKTRRVRKKTLSPEQVQELRDLFRLYDADDNGDIDATELFEALRYNERFYESDRRESVQLTKHDVERIISRFDVDANATLDLNEFIELFREDA